MSTGGIALDQRLTPLSPQWELQQGECAQLLPAKTRTQDQHTGYSDEKRYRGAQ